MSDGLPTPANDLARGIFIAFAESDLSEAAKIWQLCLLGAYLMEWAAFDLARRGQSVDAVSLIGFAVETNKIAGKLGFGAVGSVN